MAIIILILLNKRKRLSAWMTRQRCVYFNYICVWWEVEDPCSTSQAKAFDLFWATIIKNQHTHVCSVYLLSFSCEKWQINILFQHRYLLCVRKKKSETKQNTGAHFTQTKSTLWVTVWISCLIKSSFLCACSGWKEQEESSFIPVIYSYHTDETAVQKKNAQSTNF